MSEENDPEIKLTKKQAGLLEKLVKKFDALEKKVDSLTEESEEKEDADPRDVLIGKFGDAIKGILDGALPKEKLDAMSPEELLIAFDLKGKLDSEKKQEIGNEIKQKQDADISYADKVRGVVFK